LNQPLDKTQKRRQVRARRIAQAKGVMQGVLAMLRPGDLAVDCGANVGVVTKPLADTGADVIAFEPDPVAFAELENAVGHRQKVTLHQAALDIAPGKAALYRGERFDENPVIATRRSTILPGANRMDGAAMDVEVMDLPRMLQDWAKRPGGIAFVKMDIEGSELEILTEMLRLNLFDDIRLTVAELHGYKFPELRDEFKALRNTLTSKYPSNRVYLDWI